MICRTTRGGEMAGAAPPAFHRVLRADPLSVRHALTDLCRRFGPYCPVDALGRLELVLAEVLNNIVEHGIGVTREAFAVMAEAEAVGVARARAVHLLVRLEPEGLRCVITDTGVLLPSDCLAPRSLPEAQPELPEGGFGWYLIQDLVTDLTYSRSGGRNYLAFTLLVDAAKVVAA